MGDNSRGTESLDGRPEHTDALAPHIEGTWHYQISGSKLWRVREFGAVSLTSRACVRSDGVTGTPSPRPRTLVLAATARGCYRVDLHAIDATPGRRRGDEGPHHSMQWTRRRRHWLMFAQVGRRRRPYYDPRRPRRRAPHRHQSVAPPGLDSRREGAVDQHRARF